jgi:hypothetical protein
MTSDCEVPNSCLGLAWDISIHKMRLTVFLSEGPESLPVLLRVQVLLLLLFMVVLLFLAMLLLLFLAMLLFLLLVWVLFLEQVPVI